MKITKIGLLLHDILSSRLMVSIISNNMFRSLGEVDYKDEADRLIKQHQKEAEDSFDAFKDTLINDLQRDLKSIDIEMKK